MLAKNLWTMESTTNASANNNSEIIDFEGVEVWLRSLHGIVLFIILLASVVGNIFVLFLVLRNKKLQSRSILSSLGLLVANMVITVSWTSQSLSNIIAGYCPFNQAGCSILGAILNTGIYVRWCTVALITFERFCNIFFPFWYAKWSKHLLITLSIFSWLIPIATNIPSMARIGVYSFRIQYSICTVDCDTDTICLRFYLSLYGIFVSIGGLLPMLLYFSMCILGQRKSYEMRHIKIGTTNNKSVYTAKRSDQEDPQSCISVSTESSTPSSRTSSSPSDTSTKGIATIDRKILRTFVLIFINVFSTQLPIYASSAMSSNEELYSKIPLWVHFIIIYIYLLGPVLDPILIMRNKDFRDAINRTFRRRETQNSSIAHAFMDFVKIGSLLDVTPTATTGNSNKRRNSCPSNITQARISFQEKMARQKMNKANSLNGFNKETGGQLDVLEESPREEAMATPKMNRASSLNVLDILEESPREEDTIGKKQETERVS